MSYIVISLEDRQKLFNNLKELLKHSLNKLVITSNDNIYLINKKYRVSYSLDKRNFDVLYMATLAWLNQKGFSVVIEPDSDKLFKHEGYLIYSGFSICKAKANHPLLLVIESYLAMLNYAIEQNTSMIKYLEDD